MQSELKIEKQVGNVIRVVSSINDKNGHIPNSVDEKKPANLFFRNLSWYFAQFCELTTIHGMKYVGERGRYLLEKLIWMIIVAVICVLCLVLIRKTYVKWETTPVIVTLATTETPISQIPFPAVTFCPETKFDPTRFNYTKIVMKKQFQKNLTKLEETYLQISLLLCDNISEVFHLKEIKYTSPEIERVVIEQLANIEPVLNPLNITTFTWLGTQLQEEFLSFTVTTAGLCYTFNMLPDEEIFRSDQLFNNASRHNEKIHKWSLEEGYPPGDNLDSYPLRTFVSGIEGGFTMDALYTNGSQMDFLCDQSGRGFKVVLHHPSELPNMENYFLLPLDQTVHVAVKPNMITVSNELLHYEPRDRKCYFARERYLSMFKLYTQNNCLMECLANYTVLQCGCTPFYMPTYLVESIKICGPGRMDCVMASKINYLKDENSPNLDNRKCGCLPSCTSLSYDIELSQTQWDWRKAFEVLRILAPKRIFPTLETSHFSRLVVYYKEAQFLSSVRNEMYGVVDFFSNIGGLLGLCIGFSVTSVVEIVYFLTLRLICNIKKYGKNTWSGEPQLMNS